MEFYSHVNYSVTKMGMHRIPIMWKFYSHVNYSVTKIRRLTTSAISGFYSHVNYSVTKIVTSHGTIPLSFTVT